MRFGACRAHENTHITVTAQWLHSSRNSTFEGARRCAEEPQDENCEAMDRLHSSGNWQGYVSSFLSLEH